MYEPNTSATGFFPRHCESRTGAPLSLVQDADGTLRVEARVLRGGGPGVWVDAYTLDAPEGERREVVSTSWGGDDGAQRIERAGIAVGVDELGR